MIYSEIKSIEAIMTEKQILQGKIAKKENDIIREYNTIKQNYTDKFKWVNIIKSIFSYRSFGLNSINLFSTGYKMANYLIRKFKR